VKGSSGSTNRARATIGSNSTPAPFDGPACPESAPELRGRSCFLSRSVLLYVGLAMMKKGATIGGVVAPAGAPADEGLVGRRMISSTGGSETDTRDVRDIWLDQRRRETTANSTIRRRIRPNGRLLVTRAKRHLSTRLRSSQASVGNLSTTDTMGGLLRRPRLRAWRLELERPGAADHPFWRASSFPEEQCSR